MERAFSKELQNYSTYIDNGGCCLKRKKKYKEEPKTKFGPLTEAPWDELDDGVLELVLARLPVSDFYRLGSVCKGWNSLVQSPSFLVACGNVRSRGPWFYMLDATCESTIIFDMETGRWRDMNFLSKRTGLRRLVPVAASGGLICFCSSNGGFWVVNPLTGSRRELPPLEAKYSVHAIAMHTFKSSYRIVLIYAESISFGVKIYSSLDHRWVTVRANGCIEKDSSKFFEKLSIIDSEEATSVAADLGLPDMRFNRGKEFTAVGGQIVHFLNGGYRLVACDTRTGAMYNYPEILPAKFDWSIDLVECGERVLVVVLHEMMETASVRIWEFSREAMEWKQLLAMPPSLSNVYYGKKADINCVGYGSLIMICFSSRRFHQVMLCNIDEGYWMELPKCYVRGSRKIQKFVSCLGFEPRIEASV